MKKYHSAKIMFAFLGIATFASLVGTVSGSLAWYQYAARAKLSYSGTSVSDTVQLQIGLHSDKRITSYGEAMKEEVINGKYYYFAPAGSGLTSSLINKYLEENDFATNSLMPATSGSYKIGDDFSLKKSPSVKKRYETSLAGKDSYQTIDFAFRVISSDPNSEDQYVANQPLWISNAVVRASNYGDGQGNVYKAVRMYVDRKDGYDSDFIFNPSASSDGGTKVGGLLDLSRDGFYDYDSYGREVIYGQYDEDLARANISSQGYSGDDVIDDVNGINDPDRAEQFDTFSAKHRRGVRYFDKNSLSQCGIETANYLSFNTISPHRNNDGYLDDKDTSNPTSVCITGDKDHGFLGEVSVTIYLEGWDFNVIDQEFEHMFDFGLTFEINRI